MPIAPAENKTSSVADTTAGTPRRRRKRTTGVSVSARRKASTTGMKKSRAK
jgi:hypothetical protein